jgi:hypothetical protein
MDFDSPDALKSFAGDEELSKVRADAGAMLETSTVTMMSPESFTNTKD